MLATKRDISAGTLRFHDLRHSAATILLGMGIHPKIVQEPLGHSSTLHHRAKWTA